MLNSPCLAVLSVALLSLALLAAIRCGRAEDKKKDEEPVAVGTTTAPSSSPLIPSDWDGKSDWSGSVLEVIEE